MKNDTIHMNIQINEPIFVETYDMVGHAITVKILNYASSPQMEISQKV